MFEIAITCTLPINNVIFSGVYTWKSEEVRHGDSLELQSIHPYHLVVVYDLQFLIQLRS